MRNSLLVTFKMIGLLCFFTFGVSQASHLKPWKMLALNGFPEIAVEMSNQTRAALNTLDNQKLKASEKKKVLLQKISELEKSLQLAQDQLKEHQLPENTFDDVRLDLSEAKTHLQSKRFIEAKRILLDYKQAFENYVYVR